jgi:hypothetical protein
MERSYAATECQSEDRNVVIEERYYLQIGHPRCGFMVSGFEHVKSPIVFTKGSTNRRPVAGHVSLLPEITLFSRVFVAAAFCVREFISGRGGRELPLAA